VSISICPVSFFCKKYITSVKPRCYFKMWHHDCTAAVAAKQFLAKKFHTETIWLFGCTEVILYILYKYLNISYKHTDYYHLMQLNFQRLVCKMITYDIVLSYTNNWYVIMVCTSVRHFAKLCFSHVDSIKCKHPTLQVQKIIKSNYSTQT